MNKSAQNQKQSNTIIFYKRHANRLEQAQLEMSMQIANALSKLNQLKCSFFSFNKKIKNARKALKALIASFQDRLENIAKERAYMVNFAANRLGLSL